MGKLENICQLTAKASNSDYESKSRKLVSRKMPQNNNNGNSNSNNNNDNGNGMNGHGYLGQTKMDSYCLVGEFMKSSGASVNVNVIIFSFAVLLYYFSGFYFIRI